MEEIYLGLHLTSDRCVFIGFSIQFVRLFRLSLDQLGMLCNFLLEGVICSILCHSIHLIVGLYSYLVIVDPDLSVGCIKLRGKLEGLLLKGGLSFSL